MVSSTQRLLSKLLGAICAPIWMRALMFRLRRFLLVVPALLPSACELVLSGDSLLGLAHSRPADGATVAVDGLRPFVACAPTSRACVIAKENLSRGLPACPLGQCAPGPTSDRIAPPLAAALRLVSGFE